MHCITKTANIQTLPQIILFMTYLCTVSTTASRYRSIRPNLNYFRFFLKYFLFISPPIPPAPHISSFHIPFMNSIFLKYEVQLVLTFARGVGAQHLEHAQSNSSHSPQRKMTPVPAASPAPAAGPASAPSVANSFSEPPEPLWVACERSG